MTHTTEQLEGLLADATPGPWVQSHREGLDGNYRTEIYTTEDPDNTIAGCHWHSVPTLNGFRADRAANAALIAAAPTIAAELIAARKRIAKLEAGLTFYAESHSQNPNEGPWGMSSTDYGTRARAALGDAQ